MKKTKTINPWELFYPVLDNTEESSWNAPTMTLMITRPLFPHGLPMDAQLEKEVVKCAQYTSFSFIRWIFLQINENLILSNLDNTWYRQCAWRKPDWKLDDYKNKPITNTKYCSTPSNLNCPFWSQIRYCDTDLCNEFAKGSKITGLEHMIISNILMVYLFSCHL